MIKNEIAIIHHNADLDGLTSGYLAKLVFDCIVDFPVKNGSNYDLIGYNYEKDVESAPWLDFNENGYKEYVFIDVTPPNDWLESIRQNIENGSVIVTIFDHHENACDTILAMNIENLEPNYVFFNTMCGASIFYEYFLDTKKAGNFVNRITGGELDHSTVGYLVTKIHTTLDHKFLGQIVDLVESYDTWRWKKTNNINALALNEFMLAFKTVADYDTILSKNNLQQILNEGIAIINRKKLEAQNTKKLYTVINGVGACIINAKNNTYDIDAIIEEGIEIDGTKIDTCIFYKDIFFLEDRINLSVRIVHQESDFDCCAFVKELTNGNGGGHKGASGGSMKLTEFLKIIQK